MSLRARYVVSKAKDMSNDADLWLNLGQRSKNSATFAVLGTTRNVECATILRELFADIVEAHAEKDFEAFVESVAKKLEAKKAK